MQPISMYQQRGFSLLAFILGMLVGLILAAGVAFYVTKAPVPFVGRFSQQEPPKAPGNWNPNQSLQSPPATTDPTSPPQANAGTTSAPNVASVDDPVAVAALGGAMPPTGTERITPEGATGAPPVADSTKPEFYVQAGAFTSAADAEQQRARIALLGTQANISQGSASGTTVHRVRIGPFATRNEASNAQKNLASNGIEAGIVSPQP